jgi:hypothetical protein
VSIEVGQSLLRNLYPEGDVDWMAFSVAQPSSVTIALTGAPAEVVLSLVGDGSTVPVASEVGTEVILEANLEPGAHFIIVESANPGDLIPEYTVSVDSGPLAPAP